MVKYNFCLMSCVGFGLLVVLGLNGPLRQFIWSRLPEREGERKEMKDERKNVQKKHPHQLQAQ